MTNNVFKSVMGNRVWDLENIFKGIDKKKEIKFYKYVVKRELETLAEYSVVKLTSLLCELLRYQTVIDYEFIKNNFKDLCNVSRNTIYHYTMVNELDTLAEYIGEVMHLSSENYGFMYHYKKEADELNIGLNEILLNITEMVAEKTDRPINESFQLMFFAWLLFDCDVLELGKNAMKLVEKESFGFNLIK